MTRRTNIRAAGTRRLLTRAALGGVAGATVGIVGSMLFFALTSGSAPQTSHSAAAVAVDPWSCRLDVDARQVTVRAVALDCSGQQLMHLPGPYGPENALPDGQFQVGGWQVPTLLFVNGEVRLWMMNDRQNCVLRSSVTAPEPPWARVSCDVRQPTPTPARPAPRPSPTGRTA